MTTDAEALALPPVEAMRFFAGKLSVPTQRWDDVWQAAHSRAFMVAGVQADDLLAGVRGAVQKAIQQGTTLAEFRRDLAPLMQRLGWEARGRGYAAWRTRLVYETNLRGAYAAGQYEQQTDPDVLALAPIWRYRHSGARDPRPEHQAWDGLTLRHDDPFWQTHYPPNGWGCGCWVETLTERQAARQGGLSSAPEIQRRPWTDPASGRQDMVPVGIDPGWDYNPGAAWRDARDLPAPTAATPADWPPAPPAAPPPETPKPTRRTPRRPASANATRAAGAAARRATAATDDNLVPLTIADPGADALPPPTPEEHIQTEAAARANLLRELVGLAGQAEADKAANMDLDALRHRVQALRRRARQGGTRRTIS